LLAGAVAVVSIEDEVRNAIKPAVTDEPCIAPPSSQERLLSATYMGHDAWTDRDDSFSSTDSTEN